MQNLVDVSYYVSICWRSQKILKFGVQPLGRGMADHLRNTSLYTRVSVQNLVVLDQRVRVYL